MTTEVDPKIEARRRAARSSGAPATVEKSLLDGVSPESLSSDPPKETSAPAFVYRPGALVKPLVAFYETIGGIVILGDQVCGTAIVESAQSCAESLDELARTNPAVRKALIRLVSTSAATKVIVAHAPIIMVILAHHFPNALVYVSNIFAQKAQNADSDGS